LTDKILLGGAFIFLLAVPESGFVPWMTALVIGRELLITGIRGYVEALGKKFGADWFGKLKTILQCVVLISTFTVLALRDVAWAETLQRPLWGIHVVVLYAMLAATFLSGVQYCWKALKLVGR
jgi:CDP-diacylglycerol--glycerol-3-phosphate 3-phosphatidyltransferase